MSWFFRIESAHEIVVDQDDSAAFQAAVESLLHDAPNQTIIHVRGPDSPALRRGFQDAQANTDRYFKTAFHPTRAAQSPPPPSPDLRRQLADIAWRASLAEAYGGRHKTELHELVATFRQRFPDAASRMQHALDDGRALGAGRRDLHKALDRHEPEAQVVQDLLRHLFKRWPFARKSLNKIVDRALAAKGHPILGPTTLDHRLWRLQPEAAWHVFIDETGSGFDAKDAGAIWGVVIPDSLIEKIPRPSASFHAVSEPATAIDRALSDLLSFPVGIIGVEARAFAPIADPSRRWLAGVTELIDWILRLIPTAPDGRTLLTIHVEQRGEHPAGEEWEALPTALLAQLSRYQPSRANRLDLARIRVEGKNAEGAWADVIAHTWGGTSRDADARRRLLDLDRFMIGADGYDLRRMVDLGIGQGDPPIAIWRRVVHAAPRYGRDHVVHELLNRLGDIARDRPAIWRRLLDATLDALHSPDTDINALGHEIAWLDRALPPETALRPKAHLAWSLAVMAEENHIGDVSSHELFATVAELSEQLFDEDPTLVGLAELHVAVALTNRFNFEQASLALARWEQFPPSVGGLKLHAMVQSSLGQHAAFQGRHADAEQSFATALHLIDRLSDPGERALERERTAIYRAINAMDATKISDTDALALLERALGQPADVAVASLGTAASHADRFKLHALCRFAATARPAAAAIRAGLAEAVRAVGAPHAQSSTAFPWPLIWAYRAIFFSDADKTDAAARATRLARAGATVWDSAGPTLHLIGLTIEAALLPPGGSIEASDLRDVALALKAALPAASDNIARLEAWAMRAGPSPLALFEAVLPFNFR